MSGPEAVGQAWAAIIRNRATNEGIQAVVAAINLQTASGQTTRGSVIVACTQVLAQAITGAPDIAAAMRAGILALLDGYAMRLAVEEEAGE